MNYAIELGSGAVYTQSFIRIGCPFKVLCDGDTIKSTDT
jgi:hypothetical protein